MVGTSDPAEHVLQRLLSSVNAHRLDDLDACFAGDYLNETPAHPQRGRWPGREATERRS